MINVSKPYLPPFEEYSKYLKQIWDNGWLTNQGPLVSEFENQLKHYLRVSRVQFVTSGTIALNLAVNSLELKGEVITTAFSHVSGVNALILAGCKPVFVDIEDRSYCIDASKIEATITDKTSAILATHIYGYPCDVEAIQQIAKKYGLKVIYDGAHAFGVEFNNQSIFDYGDISIVSLHATKIFHSIEGGAIFTNDESLFKKLQLLKIFGLENGEPREVGTNGKNSEFHAAMGLCNLGMVGEFIEKQKQLSSVYLDRLANLPLKFPSQLPEHKYNYAYFPIVFQSSEDMQNAKQLLARNMIFARQYFYPSLNKLPYTSGNECPVAEQLAERVLCLPLYYDLSVEDAEKIATIIASYFQLNSLINLSKRVTSVS